MTQCPNWDGETTGGLSKTIASQTKTDRERADELKETIEKDNKQNARLALKELYGIIRNDYKTKKLSETSDYLKFLSEIYTSNESNLLGDEALTQMILWQMLDDDYKNSIELSKQALEKFTGDERMCIMQNLGMMYIECGDEDNAKKIMEIYAKEYADDVSGYEMLLSSYEHLLDIKELLKEEKDEEQAEEKTVQLEASLEQNYPNPGNPSTTIQYTVPNECCVEVIIYNLMGQEVRTLVNEVQKSGSHTIVWDGSNNSGTSVTSGIYLYNLKIGDKSFTKKLTILK